MLQSRAAQFFSKNLRATSKLRARRVTLGKFHTEGPQNNRRHCTQHIRPGDVAPWMFAPVFKAEFYQNITLKWNMACANSLNVLEVFTSWFTCFVQSLLFTLDMPTEMCFLGRVLCFWYTQYFSIESYDNLSQVIQTNGADVAGSSKILETIKILQFPHTIYLFHVIIPLCSDYFSKHL